MPAKKQTTQAAAKKTAKPKTAVKDLKTKKDAKGGAPHVRVFDGRSGT